MVLTACLLGCYATTHRGPQTLKPGDYSTSGGYLRFTDSDGSGGDPVELLQVEGRIGVARGIDIGYMRSFDISEGVDSDDEGIDTHWFDAKFQLLNRDNVLDKMTMALGYGFGKVANSEELWVNSLYLTFGSYHKKGAFFYSFRYETFREEINWIPGWAWERDPDDTRKAHILGLEHQLTSNLYPVVEIGRFYYDDFADGLNVFTIGVNYYARK
ncbi:MAG: hypothetical protein V3W14_08365 [Candidatus Neomarinimicrobiota bacterium]